MPGTDMNLSGNLTDKNPLSGRLHFLDNLRWITVVLVMIYHVFYIFNCSGVISNFSTQGIPCFDAFQLFVYPWFMILLFLIAGCSARYALQKRTRKEFIKDRWQRIFIPCIAGMFAYSWINGYIGLFYANDTDAEAIKLLPKAVQAFIIILSGTGSLWFGQLLFVICLLLMFVLWLDKEQIFLSFGKKANLPVLLTLAIPIWLSSYILNITPIPTYRLGIYGLAFLLGYYVFSHETVQETLAKAGIYLIMPSVLLGIVVIYLYYGQNYSELPFLEKPLINLYAWMMVLGLFGIGRKYLNFRNRFTAFMTSRCMSYYVLHYTIIALFAWLCIEKIPLPFGCYYLIISAGTAICLPPVTELLMGIPILNRLLLGVVKSRK